MNNPERILRELDRYLQRPTRIVLFGRAALLLGYATHPPEFAVTQDVDAILPQVEMADIESDLQFWDALAATNAALEPVGLYMTHLFADTQVILRPDWLANVVELDFSRQLRQLQLFRPATIDLILTKMMRHDPQDMADIGFLFQVDPIGPDLLRGAFAVARVPDVPEIMTAFAAMQPGVLALAERSQRIR